MKYNVKQAVSGIQGNLDQANQNAIVNRGLGNLFKGIQSRADLKIKQGQTANVQQALMNQQAYYDLMLQDPKIDPLKKQLALDKKNQLALLGSTIDPTNVGQFPELYGKFVGNDTASGTELDLLKLENALKVANIGAKARVDAAGIYGTNAAQKNQLEEERINKLQQLYQGLQAPSAGFKFNPFQSIYGTEPAGPTYF